MHQYEKVLSYIDYFSTAGEKTGTWVYNPLNSLYLNYSPEISSFILEVCQTDLIDTEYLSYLENIIPRGANLTDYIDTADFRLLRAILTYYVIQERFQERLWSVAGQNGSFSKVLNRLMTIQRQDCFQR